MNIYLKKIYILFVKQTLRYTSKHLKISVYIQIYI